MIGYNTSADKPNITVIITATIDTVVIPNVFALVVMSYPFGSPKNPFKKILMTEYKTTKLDNKTTIPVM